MNGGQRELMYGRQCKRNRGENMETGVDNSEILFAQRLPLFFVTYFLIDSFAACCRFQLQLDLVGCLRTSNVLYRSSYALN